MRYAVSSVGVDAMQDLERYRNSSILGITNYDHGTEEVLQHAVPHHLVRSKAPSEVPLEQRSKALARR